MEWAGVVRDHQVRLGRPPVDLDLLEDASRAIEAALRRQGFRTAQATYRREQTSGELVLTFTVTKGPLHRIGTGADLATLLVDVVASTRRRRA